MTRTGFLIVDKPAGITSHDVVATIRAVTGIRKVGHTGTLDPFATGVLPVAVGRSTRLIQFLDESCKVYEAIVSLGRSTDTADPTGEVKAEAAVPALDEAEFSRALWAIGCSAHRRTLRSRSRESACISTPVRGRQYRRRRGLCALIPWR